MCDRGIAGVYGYMCGSEINQNCVCVVVCVTERDIDDLCVCVCVCVCVLACVAVWLLCKTFSLAHAVT